jgi:hypothetical protein
VEVFFLLCICISCCELTILHNVKLQFTRVNNVFLNASSKVK